MDAFAQIRFECLQQAIHEAATARDCRETDVLALAERYSHFVIHGKVTEEPNSPIFSSGHDAMAYLREKMRRTRYVMMTEKHEALILTTARILRATINDMQPTASGARDMEDLSEVLAPFDPVGVAPDTMGEKP